MASPLPIHFVTIVLNGQPFKTGRGMLAKYGTVPTAEETDANSADMFSGFGESTP